MTAAETPHELVLVNRYDASPEQVWAAWTEPDSFVQWWCPPDWKVSDVVMEVKPDGTGMFFTRLGEFLAR